MQFKTSRLAAALVLSTAMTSGSMAYADQQVFEITITNLTYAQIISPPLVVVHNDDYSLFSDGAMASPGLANLAENGDASVLEAEALADGNVDTTANAAGGVEPGMSQTVEVAGPEGSLISVAGMLVSTNDAFFAVRGLSFPGRRGKGPRTASAPAYDAGSEANNEDCAFIPGPPCGTGADNINEPGEGFIHIHRGIHGGVGLDEAVRDWRNPVARVTIRRLEN